MQRYRINAGKVAHETIDDETIMINFDTGAYYSTDQLGMEIWEHMKCDDTLAGLCDMMARRYTGVRAEMEAALHGFLQEMVTEGLLLAMESSETASITTSREHDAPSTPFHPPVLQKYTDMQDLLLLDPIHDVDAQGWPLAKQN